MKRLLVVAPFSTVPPRYGGPIRVHNLCREASREFDVSQFAQQAQRGDLSFKFGPVSKVVSPTYREYASRDPVSLALYAGTSLRLGSPPAWQSWRLGNGAPRWLREQVAAADVIHVEHPWQFEWVARANRGRVPLLLGTENVEADLYPPERIRGPRRLAARISETIGRQEAFACAEATHILAVSDADADGLARRYGVSRERISIVPNGVDCGRFRPVPAARRAERKRLLGFDDRRVVIFAGSGHTPNIDAARKIQQWADTWPDDRTRFVIVGTVGRALTPTAAARAVITGPVADTLPYLEAADIALNPMLTGSGTNLKQLEFMAMGLAVVATPMGARGTGGKAGIDLSIGEIGEIPALLGGLLDDGDRRAAIAASGRRLVQERHCWESIGSLYRGVLRKLAE
jgi:glycosyltransferase involved in cell wall biosynthesis